MACSVAARSIFRDYDSDMVAGSLDEAYLDVTDYCVAHDVSGKARQVTSALEFVGSWSPSICGLMIEIAPGPYFFLIGHFRPQTIVQPCTRQ